MDTLFCSLDTVFLRKMATFCKLLATIRTFGLSGEDYEDYYESSSIFW